MRIVGGERGKGEEGKRDRAGAEDWHGRGGKFLLADFGGGWSGGERRIVSGSE